MAAEMEKKGRSLRIQDTEDRIQKTERRESGDQGIREWGSGHQAIRIEHRESGIEHPQLFTNALAR